LARHSLFAREERPMLKRWFGWQALFALALLSLSALFYLIHYLLFHDLHYLLNYFISNVAFLFMDVLIVVLVLQGLLQYREKQAILKKLNMVIGTFFIEVGTPLMKALSAFVVEPERLRALVVGANWKDADFNQAVKTLRAHDLQIESRRGNLPALKKFLQSKRPFLLNLLENANLLEHELFSDLLWATFHLTDELEHRRDFRKLPEADFRHLSGDIQRASSQLFRQWLAFMRHLKKAYPYLYSLAVRTNPFDPQARVELRQ
jgi:hypothetical protein